jgi:predicted DsbA family dithiol-disulfide isomerase
MLVPEAEPTPVVVWVDPSCPWAWQTSRWLRDLRDQGVIGLRWRLYSLELNATYRDGLSFHDAAATYGHALTTLALARRERGAEGLERLYVAVGERLHDAKESMSPELLLAAADEVGLTDLPARAAAMADLAHEVTAEFTAGRDASVFGVPTLEVDGAPPIYGPILPTAARDEEALEWWMHVRWLAQRADFFELKRWPRTSRPGGHG